MTTGVPRLPCPPHASIATYIRQRGACRVCGCVVALSRGWFYETVPETDPYWTRVYRSPQAASIAYRLAAAGMCRMACRRCAPPGARRRKYPLVPRDALRGIIAHLPDVLQFVIDNYTRLWYRTVSRGEMEAEYTEFIAAYPRTTVSESAFIDLVFRRLRRSLGHPGQRAGRTDTDRGTFPRRT